ncbi:MAG: NAD-dependent epimerase/dehydratase family protein [Nitrospiraceae bacterium]
MDIRDTCRAQRCLVVGGAGFVGSNLVRLLLNEGCEDITIIDNLLSAERSNIPDDPRIEFREGSIADDGLLRHVEDEYPYIFHLATYHGNQSSIANPLEDHANNLITTLKLYERIRHFQKLKKVVYAASGCTLAPHTYEQAEATTEDGPVPIELDSPYQISKVVGEFYSVYYYHQHALPTVRARFQNVYGPGEILGAGRWRGSPATVWRNVTPSFTYRAIKQMPLRVEHQGRASRDFIYVEDIARGLMRCAMVGQPGDVYNLASGVETSILALATLVNTLTGNPAPIEFLPERPWDRSGKRFGSTEKAKRCLGFEARVTLTDGLRRTIEWTRQHLPIIDGCIEKHAAQMKAGAATA